MPLLKHINRIEQLDQLIRLKRTGPPEKLARKLDISERWLYKLLGELRNELDCPITYNRCRQSYEYEEPGRLIVGFQKEIEDTEAAQLTGGFSEKICSLYLFVQ